MLLRTWPDPGLSRNTRCRCYRCSVPGLAGFTRLALCGARDLINHSIFNCQLLIVPLAIEHVLNRQLKIGNDLNLGLAMREQTQKTIN